MGQETFSNVTWATSSSACCRCQRGGLASPGSSVLGDQTPSFKSSSSLIPAACKCPGSLVGKEAMFQDQQL